MALSNAAMSPSVCLSVCLSHVPSAKRRTLIGNHTLDVEPTSQRGRNGNEAVAGAASEAFARWLHHRYAPFELPSARGISFRLTIP